MRDFVVHHGSGQQGRGDQRYPNGKPRQQNTPRSRRAVNLSRLGDAVGLDTLGAALGLTEQSLRSLMEGRDAAREAQYAVHLNHKLEDAGIPSNWLDRDTPPIPQELMKSLRALAAESPNKAPIRRANFKRLAQAFDGRLPVLADAVEMLLPSVMGVVEGRLELDDYRFGHINPRLMRAGFSDGWLEQPNPDLNDALLESLEQLATDEYEASLADEEDVVRTVGQAFVSPPPEQVVAAQGKLAVTPVVELKKESNMATPNLQKQQPEEAGRASFAPPEFKAAGIPGASAPAMPHPSTTAKLTRGVLSAGKPLREPVVHMKPAGSKKLAVAPVAAAAAAATAAATPTPAAATPTQSRSAQSRGSVSKETSLGRADALEQLLNGARRGAKVTLWRDLLGSSLPYWGNVRRGAVLFKDELADQVTTALGLPAGWLDNPNFPPATLAAWVTDANVPLPTTTPVTAPTAAAPAQAPTAAPAAAEASPPTKRPYIRRTPPASPQLTLTSAPAAAPVLPSAAAVPQAAPAPAPVVALQPAPTPSLAAPAVAPQPAAPVPAQLASAPQVSVAGAGLSWTPPQGQPGPVCLALVATLTGLSSSGQLTEQAALQMLTSLMSAPR